MKMLSVKVSKIGYALFLLVIFSFVFLTLSTNTNDIDVACSIATNCSECMQAHPQCHWCTAESYRDDLFNGRSYRCASKDTLIARNCPVGDIEFTTTTTIPIETKEDTIQQLKPVRQEATLRPGDTYIHKLVFNQMKDYPVDIYYLTDISYSMKDDLETISKLADDIAREMKNLTKQLRLGFGSFVDKPLFPFVGDRTNPCANSNLYCDPPYLYQHYLALTENITEFKRMTKSANASGNVDFPEGGLDALMQVALCDAIVGWRKEARKIVLFTTDGGFHVAGDGRLAGLISPPPSQCSVYDGQDKLDGTRKYVGYHDAIYHDYPSVGELGRILQETNINVIFGVIGDYTRLYERLAAQLPIAKVGEIKENSSNIVNLIKDNYRSIVSVYQLTFKPDNDVSVKIFTKCYNDTKFEEKSKCDKHPLGKSIEYDIKIQAQKCFPNEKKFEFNFRGLSENATLILKTACDCCKLSKEPTKKSEKCHNNGVFKCGICHCDPGRSGEFCECATPDDDTSKCINPNVTNAQNVKCSNRGRCQCGTCKCIQPEKYSGQYCQCDTQACPLSSDDRQVCGGKLRGTCQCDGTCLCNPAYIGPKCDCLKDNSPCFDANGQKCSGHGECDCGLCVCNHNYRGPKCEYSSGEVTTGLCNNEALSMCVLCVHKNAQHQFNLSLSSICYEECNNLTNVQIQPIIIDKTPDYLPDLISCIVHDEKSCVITFHYLYTKVAMVHRVMQLSVSRTNICPSNLPVHWIVIGVLVGVVIIGVVIILVWKLVVTIDDQREMARFTREQENAKWQMEENPIFKEPVTKVTNPMYNGDN